MTAGTRYVGFLRAVNVGRRTVPMARLREEFAALGFTDVSTYINSGNVIFSAAGRPAALVTMIEQRLCEAFGFAVPVFLRTADEVRQIVACAPFGAVSGADTHMVAFLRKRPTVAQRVALEGLATEVDELVVDGRAVHWLIHGKVLDSRISAKQWQAAAGTAATTTRNTTMLRKLAAQLDR